MCGGGIFQNGLNDGFNGWDNIVVVLAIFKIFSQNPERWVYWVERSPSAGIRAKVCRGKPIDKIFLSCKVNIHMKVLFVGPFNGANDLLISTAVSNKSNIFLLNMTKYLLLITYVISKLQILNLRCF